MFKFALAYDAQDKDQPLRLVQMSDDQGDFPATVRVGDLYRGKPVVGLARSLEGVTQLLQDKTKLSQRGQARLLELRLQQRWRYYLLFRFYTVEPPSATTVEEKVAIALLGETQTVRVIGCHDPETVNVVVVWQHLQAQATPANSVLKGEPLDGAAATVKRSVDAIDTQSDEYKDWQPLGTQLLNDPCPTVTVEATVV